MLESCGLVKLDYNALKIYINTTVSLHWSELPCPPFYLVFSKGRQITIQIKHFKMVRDGENINPRISKLKPYFKGYSLIMLFILNPDLLHFGLWCAWMTLNCSSS